MGARTGEQFLQGLRGTKRQLWLEGERVDDVTTHPALAGGARTLASVFDRLHAFRDECLIPDPETGEPWLKNRFGSISGRAIKPIGLRVVAEGVRVWTLRDGRKIERRAHYEIDLATGKRLDPRPGAVSVE